MNNNRQRETCLKKLASLKHQILNNTIHIGHLDANATHSRRKTYETLDFLWLNIVLTALKYVHIREKRQHLMFLQETQGERHLTAFYKLIGIEGFATKTPSIGFFSDYVKYFDAQELEDIQNKALRQIAFIQAEFNLLSIDGKDIRNCKGRNVKSINVVVNHALRASFITDSETAWIKKYLTEVIEEYFKEDPTRYVFIGDGIYHNTTIRHFFEDKGYLAILPMMGLTKQFKERLNTTQGIKINQNKHVVSTTHGKRNGMLLKETVLLIPLQNTRYSDFKAWTYVIDITTETTRLKDGLWSTKNRRFLTNLDLSCNLATTTKLRALIRQHWQVETFHQYKDVNLLEDKYSKARDKAGYKSIINNFARLVQTICGVNNKHEMEMFKNHLLLLVAFLFLFLTEQH